MLSVGPSWLLSASESMLNAHISHHHISPHCMTSAENSIRTMSAAQLLLNHYTTAEFTDTEMLAI